MINVINLLDNIHFIILHQGTNKLKDKIEELKIYYYGIHEDLEQIKYLCSICIQKNMSFYNREPCKQIIMDRAFERFAIDLTFLPFILYKNNNFKYLLNIVDHFPKFIISYPI